MKTLKKNNISKGSSINSPVPVNKNCDLPPFFNPDYFAHVVVQTIEELNSIPCKLRQDGMVATVVQEDYSDYQLQTSRTGFGICDNNAWVKISIGDEVFNGGNLFLFQTEEQANEFMGSTQSKEGQIIYISDLDRYFKFDGQDGLTDAFPNKLDKPTEQGGDNTNYKIPAYLDGKPYWRSSSDFEKVKSVNSKTGDVVLKTSDLQNDSDYTTNALLNKKLNKPTTNNTNQFVILGDGSTAPKNDFGKVDTVNKIEPDSNKNVNLGIDDILPKGMPLKETLDDNKKVLLYDDAGKSYWKSLSEVGKVKTVNNQEPDEQGNIDLEKNEFVKNGKGWSLKYRVDNQSFYGVIGDKAIDVSYTTSANTDVNFPYGAIGMYSFTAGYKNSVLGLASTVLGAINSSSGQSNHIISYRSIITEDRGTGNVGKHSNGIFAGEGNAINDNIQSVIVGGNTNKILGNPDAKSGAFSKANVIIGGWNNEIFSSSETNRPAYSSFILGGELNKAQGYYNIVGGYSNHAVTAGETLFGFYGTVQNTSLNGYDYIENSRMFNVGVGLPQTNNTIIRRDGLSVYRNGLVLIPTTNNALIEANNKAVTTKEFVDNKISNFSLPTNWGSPQQRFSGLEDKSSDATYNRLLGMNSNGNANEVGLPALTNEMSKATDAQKEAWRIASRKTGETYSTGQPRVDLILPIVLIGEDSTLVQVNGLNLFLNNTDYSAKVEIIDVLSGQVVETITNIQVNQSSPTTIYFNINRSLYEEYNHYTIRVTHNEIVSLVNNSVYFQIINELINEPINMGWDIKTERLEGSTKSYSVTLNANNIYIHSGGKNSLGQYENKPIIGFSDFYFTDDDSMMISYQYTCKAPSSSGVGQWSSFFGIIPEENIPPTALDLMTVENNYILKGGYAQYHGAVEYKDSTNQLIASTNSNAEGTVNFILYIQKGKIFIQFGGRIVRMNLPISSSGRYHLYFNNKGDSTVSRTYSLNLLNSYKI